MHQFYCDQGFPWWCTHIAHRPLGSRHHAKCSHECWKALVFRQLNCCGACVKVTSSAWSVSLTPKWSATAPVATLSRDFSDNPPSAETSQKLEVSHKFNIAQGESRRYRTWWLKSAFGKGICIWCVEIPALEHLTHVSAWFWNASLIISLIGCTESFSQPLCPTSGGTPCIKRLVFWSLTYLNRTWFYAGNSRGMRMNIRYHYCSYSNYLYCYPDMTILYCYNIQDFGSAFAHKVIRAPSPPGKNGSMMKHQVGRRPYWR